MKKWSRQWTQFMQNYCVKKPEKKKIQDFNGVWTRDLAIPVRCPTNWAMEPLMLGAGQLLVHMFPWKKWVLMIYEINHIWTVEMKWKWTNDHCSEHNLCNCIKKPEKKKFTTSTGFESVTSRFFRLLYTIAYKIAFTVTIISSFSFHFHSSYDLFHISLTLISFTGTYEPTIDLLLTSVTS